MLLVVLVVMSLLAGAAAHLPMPVFLAAVTAVGGWLLLFGVRERLGRAKRF